MKECVAGKRSHVDCLGYAPRASPNKSDERVDGHIRLGSGIADRGQHDRAPCFVRARGAGRSAAATTRAASAFDRSCDGWPTCVSNARQSQTHSAMGAPRALRPHGRMLRARGAVFLGGTSGLRSPAKCACRRAGDDRSSTAAHPLSLRLSRYGGISTWQVGSPTALRV
jgi:hypothetical protein